jgi:hypothetical protein
MTKPIQLNLFDQPTLNVVVQIKEAINRDAHESGLSRETIVDRMNDLAARYGISLARGNIKRLSTETFEKWLNPSEPTRQIPLKALPVFCAAVGRSTAMDVLARSIGLRVIGDREQKLLDWAEAKMAIKAHGQKLRKIEAEL